MSVTVNINGTNFTIPETPEKGWGEEVTAWIAAASSGLLQKQGGQFTLTEDVDFGATKGLLLKFVSSRTGAATSGILRLANNEEIAWRNQAGSADLILKVGTDNKLYYNGIEVVDISSAQTLENKTLTSPVINTQITGTAIKNENDMQSDSELHVATQKSIKTYVDNRAAGSNVKADLYDPVTTTLPTGSVTIDGVTVVENTEVLFTNLTAYNNRVYAATVVGGNVTAWTAQQKFSGDSLDPSQGESVRISNGDIFNTQLAVFDGTDFTINNPVRYFNGVDFVEHSGPIEATLAATPATGNLFTVAFNNSENWEISYSLKNASGKKEIGKLYITVEASNPIISRIASPETAELIGVEFTATLNGADLEIDYLNAAEETVMKYHYTRWSDGAGGPAAIPSYTTGTSTAASAGAVGEVQIAGAGGQNTSDSKFKWDLTNSVLNLDGYKIEPLISNSLSASVGTPTTILTYTKADNKHLYIDYSLERVSDGATQIGRLLVTQDGTNTSITDDSTSTGTLAVIFSATISGADLLIQYTNGSASVINFKHSVRRWS